MCDENVNDNWDEISDIELEKRLQTEKQQREQEMNVTKQNGLSVLSNGGPTSEFKPRILQRPKEAPQKVTILKRPDSSSSLSASFQQQTAPKPPKTLEQREKEYAEARRRILGSEVETSTEPIKQPFTKTSPSSSSNNLSALNFNPQQQKIPDNILRNPRGPIVNGTGFNIKR